MTVPHRRGFETQREEVTSVELPVEGELPAWLTGTYVGNGPGQFEVGDRTLGHWFDPLAMVRGLDIGDGVTYTNRFVRSHDFVFARERGRVRTQFPGTAPDRPVWTRLRQALTGEFPDNPVIGVARIDGELAAITESPVALTLDPDTLETTGRTDLTTDLDADLTLGHPHYDPWRECLVNLGVSYGRATTYTLFRRDGPATAPTATVAFDDAPYVHSFALTERYAVLPAMPFGLDPRKLLLGAITRRTFVESFERFDRPGEFVVVDRETGAVATRNRVDPLFVYHHVNAFRDGDDLVVDLVGYRNQRAVTDLTLANLRGESPSVPRGDLQRYRLPLDGGRATGETLRAGHMEFPVVDYPRVLGRQYDHVYVAEADGESALPTRLARVTVPDGEAVTWREPGTFPGEPIFVRAPDGADAEGVVLSVVLDGENDGSSLIVLDAATMTERARAPLPHRLPYGFHGQFYAADDPVRSMA
ncbi:carotenoid oxygenase family protein [Haloarcula onubensis]|uniref:Carotenoid oxygenase family protein n=1 Tax=Haloarcula onubensis TaxID=2950539 RepID=A0ABU2FJL3_9EURY|nr:carotenoid oxygenase family protein [Halomicroarcula sp. S3CR25-11]MDS0280950.1 carotenoid oxygenase family protein [Halomicroarcula sp. S3CR25-11]